MSERVLHRDSNLIVLDKPAGMACHPGPGTRQSIEDWLPELAFGNRNPPVLAHRLDHDTAGCLILARHEKAARRLGRLFSDHKIEKIYWALVEGVPEAESGVTDLPLLKVNSRQGWRMTVNESGQQSLTEWRVLGRAGGLSWIECRPRTGRTHQIRIHMASLGCPILADPIYGTAKPGSPHALLCREMMIPYHQDREPVRVTAEPPAHMVEGLRACGWTA